MPRLGRSVGDGWVDHVLNGGNGEDGDGEGGQTVVTFPEMPRRGVVVY